MLIINTQTGYTNEVRDDNPNFELPKGWALFDGATNPEPTQSEAIPEEVANWQLKVEMASRLLLDPLNAAIAAIPNSAMKAEAQAKWQVKPTIRREDPLIASLAGALSLSSDTVDDIFLQASKRV